MTAAGAAEAASWVAFIDARKPAVAARVKERLRLAAPTVRSLLRRSRRFLLLLEVALLSLWEAASRCSSQVASACRACACVSLCI